VLSATTHTVSRQDGIRKRLQVLDVQDELGKLWESGLLGEHLEYDLTERPYVGCV